MLRGLGQKGKKSDPLNPDGSLTTDVKKRILINNIYGVDIDSNAVEVTKLSLLLKCLEGETQASIQSQMTLFNERVLPTLDQNIKCGNSLVSTDFFEMETDSNALKRVKPFNWQIEFKDIFKQGGFDAVIGNPPWVSLNGRFGSSLLTETESHYLIAKYNGNTYMPNMYEYFIALGLNLLNSRSKFSLIVPDRLAYNDQFISLREKIIKQFQIESLVFRAPFPNVIVDTLIFSISTEKNNKEFTVIEYGKSPVLKSTEAYLSSPTYKFYYDGDVDISNLFDRIESMPEVSKISDIIDSTSGFGGNSKLFTAERLNKKQIRIIRGRNIDRYKMLGNYFFDFADENLTGRTRDVEKLGFSPKVLLRKTGNKLIATYLENDVFPEQSLYFLYKNRSQLNLKYILGLLNSRLLNYIYIGKFVTNLNSTPQLKKVDLDNFPIRNIKHNIKPEKQAHDKIVDYVNRLLELNKSAEPDQKQIQHYENQIDKLVYELYGLTEDEIKIIEEATSGNS